MKKAIAKLRSASPYSQSRFHDTPKLNKENHKDYEERTWSNRLHVNQNGCVIIPPMQFKNSLSGCAKYLSIQIPGKGKSTYTKHFEAGVMVINPLILPYKKDEIKGEWLLCSAKGDRGGTTRVLKCFPVIHEWGGIVEYHIFDDTITEEVFISHLKQCGQFIGLGRFRPRNNGYYGRFSVEDVTFEDMKI